MSLRLRESESIDRSGLATSLEFGIAAWCYLRLSISELEHLRRQPALRFPVPVTPQFLRHSDEQSITALAAVFQALGGSPMSSSDFSSWAIVAAPRFLGRAALAASMHRYETDGPWGASVQVVPQRSQHSVASTLSIVLGAKGPCIGAGGGVWSDDESLLAAAGLLCGERLPGVWLVLSGWDPELGIDRAGKPITNSDCTAFALALVADPAAEWRGKLRVCMVPRGAVPPEKNGGLLASLACLLNLTVPLPVHTFSLLGSSRAGISWELELRPDRSACGNSDRNTLHLDEDCLAVG